jgi:hypothetical protein
MHCMATRAGFEKFLLTDAAKNGAVCLDGSPGAFVCHRAMHGHLHLIFDFCFP